MYLLLISLAYELGLLEALFTLFLTNSTVLFAWSNSLFPIGFQRLPWFIICLTNLCAYPHVLFIHVAQSRYQTSAIFQALNTLQTCPAV